MERVIREGSLRLLATENSCDVILSCGGQKLMAHKVMLSIASPVLQDLLLDVTATEPAFLIFPDINVNIMMQILDYIYTGSVMIHSGKISEFLEAANLLKVHLDTNYLEKFSPKHLDTKNEIESNIKTSKFDELKPLRRIPNLMPISVLQFGGRKKKEPYNSVLPGPWCRRQVPLLVDPKTDCLHSVEQNAYLSSHTDKKENDTNNNIFQLRLGRSDLCAPEDVLFKAEDTHPFPTTVLESRPEIKDQLTDTQSSPEKCIPISYKIKVKLKEQEDELVSASETTKSAGILEENKTDVVDDDKRKPFKCGECGKCFSQLRNYKYHRSMHEGTKEFAANCPECGKIFNDRGYLSSHLKIHRDRKEYACPHCPKRFNQRVAYNMHLRIHTGMKPHECPTCGKSFSRKMLLKQHQRVHTGERPYSCPECGKSFADRSNMSLHARLHTGVKPYACSLCSKSFTKKHHLKTHMNFHTGLKPYSCQKCGLSFSQSSNMRTHYKKCVLKSQDTSFNAESQTT